jgi:hypothetical protein
MEGLTLDARSAAAGCAAGLVIGGCTAYALARRTFEARLTAELVTIKNHYDRKLLDLEFKVLANRLPDLARGGGDEDFGEAAVGPDPVDAADTGDGAGSVEEDEPPAKSQERNLFEEAKAQAEIDDRGAIYPVSQEDHLESVEGYQQVTVTYYAGDKVLADDKDQPIPDIIRTTGQLTPLLFGGISGDPHIRYVRNENLLVDFEIILNKSSYVDVVLNYGRPGGRT